MNARALALMVLLFSLSGVFGAATAAHAQTYIEIWNPPEARAHPPVRRGTRPKAATPHLAKRVTEHAVAGESAAATAAIAPPKKHDVPALPLLPPKIGPDGRVLQV